MRVSNGNTPSGAIQDTVDAIQRNLASIAQYHNVSVSELIESAQSAGVDGPRYLARVLSMVRRLDKLQGNE